MCKKISHKILPTSTSSSSCSPCPPPNCSAKPGSAPGRTAIDPARKSCVRRYAPSEPSKPEIASRHVSSRTIPSPASPTAGNSSPSPTTDRELLLADLSQLLTADCKLLTEPITPAPNPKARPNCSLLTAHCSLHTADCKLLTDPITPAPNPKARPNCSLLTAHCSLPTADCKLLTDPITPAPNPKARPNCSLLTAHC